MKYNTLFSTQKQRIPSIAVSGVHVHLLTLLREELPHLLETNVLGVLSEAPSTDLESILSDDTVVASTHAAVSKKKQEQGEENEAEEQEKQMRKHMGVKEDKAAQYAKRGQEK